MSRGNFIFLARGIESGGGGGGGVLLCFYKLVRAFDTKVI